MFLGSMLPQYMALCVSQFVSFKKICVSVRWVTLWERTPPVSVHFCTSVIKSEQCNLQFLKLLNFTITQDLSLKCSVEKSSKFHYFQLFSVCFWFVWQAAKMCIAGYINPLQGLNAYLDTFILIHTWCLKRPDLCKLS